MALKGSGVHRSGALKQQNKKHNTLGHKTKGQVRKISQGRVSVVSISKRAKRELNREQRKHQLKQHRATKREENAAKKRSLGTSSNPPFLVAVVALSPDINPRRVLTALTACDPEATVTTSTQGTTHVSSPRFKQRFAFVVPPVNDLYAILDTVKVASTVMVLWPHEELSEAAEVVVSSIMAQGLPSPVHLASLDDMASKRKIQARQRLTKEIEARFPGGATKLLTVDSPQEALVALRHIGSQKQRPVFYRDHRPHLMAEKLEFVEEGSTGTLKVTGYVRGQPLSVNALVHIPGWADYQISQITSSPDPHPLERRGKREEEEVEGEEVLEVADPEKQESLISTNEIDPMEGEQTWPTQEELEEAEEAQKVTRTKRVPKGTSEYQAAWIVDSEEDDGDDEEEDDDEDDADLDDDMAPVDAMSQDDHDEVDDEEDDEEYETMTIATEDGGNYDDKVDYQEDMDALEKLRAARDDAEFPDEIDTPLDVPARVRFQKYRGLQSFRTSAWDADENLPLDYARIFQFKNFQHTRKRLLLADDREGVQPGSYVTLYIKDVPRHLYDAHRATHAPLVLFSLLPHEHKMSVMNAVIKSHQAGHYRAVRSKERLVFHVGFRRFANCPIFSENTTGNKHKFARYFHPGTTVVASMFAPITFPPSSVLVFRERQDGAQELIATGSLHDMNPKRIVTKRVVLSGHPFKINRKSAVIRYMFFNREDVMWFKPVELRTKWGRRGHIREALGTHGHMKCYFDGQLKAQDCALLHLYKRMFPKWNYDPHVARPPPLYLFHSSVDAGRDAGDAEDEFSPSKRQKMVQFHNSKQ